MDLILLALGLALLTGAGDALVRGAVALSLKLGIPAVIIGATVIGFGTSAPELLVSVEAALKDAPGIALGNVVGSNIANVFLVLGIPALILPLAGWEKGANRNTFIMLGATAVFGALMMMETLPRWAGLLLAAICLAMIWDSTRAARAARAEAEAKLLHEIEELEHVDPAMPRWKVAALIAAGLIGLPLGADLLIEGARGIAREFGVSEAVIGLTVVAVGTSLPELATTVTAALKREPDMAIGNVLGSNIFNITGIIGIATLVSPLAVPDEIPGRDIWWMIAASLVLVPFVLMRMRISRPVGAGFLALYGVYIYQAFSG